MRYFEREYDEGAEYTFTGGRGNTVIDYVIGDKEIRGKMNRMRIGERIDSDHHPIEVWIRGKGQEGGRSGVIRGDRYWRGIWNKEDKKMFKRK